MFSVRNNPHITSAGGQWPPAFLSNPHSALLRGTEMTAVLANQRMWHNRLAQLPRAEIEGVIANQRRSAGVALFKDSLRSQSPGHSGGHRITYVIANQRRNAGVAIRSP